MLGVSALRLLCTLVCVCEALNDELCLTRASQNDFTDQDKPISHPILQEMMHQPRLYVKVKTCQVSGGLSGHIRV